MEDSLIIPHTLRFNKAISQYIPEEEQDSSQIIPQVPICQICGQNQMKYTCPSCKRQTCSLHCIN